MNKITFRQPEITDADKLLEHINLASKEETYIRKQGHQLTKEDELKYLKQVIKDIDEKKVVVLLAFDGEVLVGTADVKAGFGSEKHVGVFGIIVKKEYRNQGIGSELMKKTLEAATKSIKDLEIITLGVFADNKRALHLYEKFDFKKYGELPNGMIRKGKHCNHIYMYKQVK